MAARQTDIVAALPRLRRLARALCRDRSAADDLVQDTAAQALSALASFDGANLRAWLNAIMVNRFRSDLRRFGRLPVLVALDSPVSTGFGSAGEPELGFDIKRALLKLPEDQRIAILLLTLDGCSYAEIAAIQNVAAGTVMSRIARAREALRLDLGDGRQKMTRQHS